MSSSSCSSYLPSSSSIRACRSASSSSCTAVATAYGDCRYCSSSQMTSLDSGCYWYAPSTSFVVFFWRRDQLAVVSVQDARLRGFLGKANECPLLLLVYCYCLVLSIKRICYPFEFLNHHSTCLPIFVAHTRVDSCACRHACTPAHAHPHTQ